jgi:hypothetical protein
MEREREREREGLARSAIDKALVVVVNAKPHHACACFTLFKIRASFF